MICYAQLHVWRNSWCTSEGQKVSALSLQGKQGETWHSNWWRKTKVLLPFCPSQVLRRVEDVFPHRESSAFAQPTSSDANLIQKGLNKHNQREHLTWTSHVPFNLKHEVPHYYTEEGSKNQDRVPTDESFVRWKVGYKWTEKAFNSPSSLLFFSSYWVQIAVFPKDWSNYVIQLKALLCSPEETSGTIPEHLPKCLQLASTSSPLNTSHPKFPQNTIICPILHTYPSSLIFSLQLIKSWVSIQGPG